MVIAFQRKFAERLRLEKAAAGKDSVENEYRNHKFKILCTIVGNTHLADISEHYYNEKYRELDTTLKAMWYDDMTKNGLISRKLSCVFKYPIDSSSLLSVDHTDTERFQIHNKLNKGEANVFTDTKPSDSQIISSTDDVGELSKKYNELVDFSVKLTSERDRFRNALKSLTYELELLKSEKNQTISSGLLSDTDNDIYITKNIPTSTKSYHLWLMIVATATAFFLGHYFTWLFLNPVYILEEKVL